MNLSDEEIEQHKQEGREIKILFNELAEITRNNNSPPLNITHCIRNLAFSDESRKNN